jgi:hypothetical protein
MLPVWKEFYPVKVHEITWRNTYRREALSMVPVWKEFNGFSELETA